MPAQILVVDDDPSVSDVLVRFLERDGYTVTVAHNGRAALERVAHHRPDLILLDVMMPEMDGFTVCQRLKDDERTALIPITMLTGQDDYEHRRRGIEAGADDFLAKPFEQSILRARIRSQLRLKRLTDQLEHTERVIFTLARAIEAKDSYTEAHLRRMQTYSEMLARACGLDSREVQLIGYAGILHDIGKIGVSESILCKAGPLTPEERLIMCKHPLISEHIIAEMRFAGQIGPVIRAHHEFWNGSGYPDGLEGENIPLGARILAIVDAYDAMTSDRPYRTALGEKEAIVRLRAGSGIQFDPDILAVFLKLLDTDMSDGSLVYAHGETRHV